MNFSRGVDGRRFAKPANKPVCGLGHGRTDEQAQKENCMEEILRNAFRTLKRLSRDNRLSEEEQNAISMLAGMMAADYDELERIWDNQEE